MNKLTNNNNNYYGQQKDQITTTIIRSLTRFSKLNVAELHTADSENKPKERQKKQLKQAISKNLKSQTQKPTSGLPESTNFKEFHKELSTL